MKVATEIYECPTEEVLVADRVRKEFDQKELAKLAESIQSKGLLQPGVCRKNGDGYELVAGERRLRACELANKPYRFTLSEETDEAILLEIELEENLCRVDLSFMEEAAGMEKLHALLQEKAKTKTTGKTSHGIRETAAFLNKSLGAVSDDLLIAKFGDVKEVREAKNKTEAKKIIKRIAEDYQRAEAFKKIQEQEIKEKAAEGEDEELSDEELFVLRAQTYQKKILHGEMEEILPTLDKQFDIIIFDPPWGVDLDKVSSRAGSKRSYADGEEEFAKLKSRLEIIYRALKDDSHLYMFFGIRQHQEVYDILESVGFETNRIPIIWHKIGAHRTRNPDKWPGRSYEGIAFARKGNKILVRKGAPDLIQTRPMFGKAAGSHRSAKSPEVHRDLLLRSALPGEKILDPMCGSGGFAVAAEAMAPTHKLDWLMIEKEKAFVDLSLTNIMRGYSDLMLMGEPEEEDGSDT